MGRASCNAVVGGFRGGNGALFALDIVRLDRIRQIRETVSARCIRDNATLLRNGGSGELEVASDLRKRRLDTSDEVREAMTDHEDPDASVSADSDRFRNILTRRIDDTNEANDLEFTIASSDVFRESRAIGTI